jgi:hypothetical protein
MANERKAAMNHLHHLMPLVSSQYAELSTPLRVAIIVGLAAAAAVAVAVIIFGNRYLGGTTR